MPSFMLAYNGSFYGLIMVLYTAAVATLTRV